MASGMMCEGCGKEYAQPSKYKTLETRGPLKINRMMGLYEGPQIDFYVLCTRCFEKVEDKIESIVRGGSLVPRGDGITRY